MTSWVRTFAFTLEISTDVQESDVWFSLSLDPSKMQSLLDTLATLEIAELPDIALSMVNWFDKWGKTSPEGGRTGFLGVMEEFVSYWCDRSAQEFENMTYDDKKRSFRGMFQMDNNLLRLVPYGDEVPKIKDLLRDCMEKTRVSSLDLIDERKLKKSLGRTTNWSKTLAVSLSLPAKATIQEILDTVVNGGEVRVNYLVESCQSLQLKEYGPILESLIDWYLLSTKNPLIKSLDEFKSLMGTFLTSWIDRIVTDFTEMGDEEQEEALMNLAKVDDMLIELSDLSVMFSEFHLMIDKAQRQVETLQPEE